MEVSPAPPVPGPLLAERGGSRVETMRVVGRGQLRTPRRPEGTRTPPPDRKEQAAVAIGTRNGRRRDGVGRRGGELVGIRFLRQCAKSPGGVKMRPGRAATARASVEHDLRSRMNRSGLTAPAARGPRSGSGAVARPVFPTAAIASPRFTIWPGFTKTRRVRVERAEAVLVVDLDGQPVPRRTCVETTTPSAVASTGRRAARRCPPLVHADLAEGIDGGQRARDEPAGDRRIDGMRARLSRRSARVCATCGGSRWKRARRSSPSTSRSGRRLRAFGRAERRVEAAGT
jgi:hypothetical protein